MILRAVLAVTLFAACALAADEAALARRQESLNLLLRLLPSTAGRKITGRINGIDKSWEDWQRRTGELPPDFEAMPSSPFLPDALEGVKAPADWTGRRRQIRAAFEQWVYGSFPPTPDNLRAAVTSERTEGGIMVRDVRLEFGPDHRATLRLQLLIPPGSGPFPVFLTNHPRTRPWVATAVRRGYIGCIYYATDPVYGNGDDSDAFLDVYPEATFSCIARWAWSAMRAVDYLVTRPEVDKAKIAITGHSRNGKQALVAAAFDTRIGAVALSSGNTGEGNPWRYTTDPFANESIEQITTNFPHWFHPRLRFFAGHEDRLPVDQHSLMALVAPRGLLMASAFPEGQGAPWGFEQAYRCVREVYKFLGRPQNVGLSLRAGEHPTVAEDIEKYVDFFDTVFGRGHYPRPETWIHGYTFDNWKRLSRETISSPKGLTAEERIRWALGDEPAGVPFPARRRPTDLAFTSDGWLAGLYGRPLKVPGATSASFSFGDDLHGDLYLPSGRDRKLPAVIWLHGHSYATGYSRYAAPVIQALTEKGIAVLAFDQIGFGTRLQQATRFYERYPHWSLMGKMVADTRAAFEALASLDVIDPERISLAGYALGGKVALFTAALEPRIRAVASLAAFTPLRTADATTEGIGHYSHLHGLLPRLRFYIGQEEKVPVDYDNILTAVAPRPVLVIAPTLDRYAPVKAVTATVESARRGGANITLLTPEDFNRFTPERRKELVEWLAGW